MHHPVMRPAEPEGFQLMVGIADEVAIGEEQQLNDIQRKVPSRPGAGGASAARESGAVWGLEKFMSAILTYLGFNVTKQTIAAKF
jgi:hypothetical protein